VQENIGDPIAKVGRHLCGISGTSNTVQKMRPGNFGIKKNKNIDGDVKQSPDFLFLPALSKSHHEQQPAEACDRRKGICNHTEGEKQEMTKERNVATKGDQENKCDGVK
jgi:hypothetical protein